MSTEIKNMLEIYFIAGTQDCKEGKLLSVLEQALQAGITCFQFREKGEGSRADDIFALKKLAKQCQKLCNKYSVPFIMNDYVNLAIELSADGVHVGQNDQSIYKTIEQVDGKMIIGYSTNNVEQFTEAESIKGIDYVGIGPAFQTVSKKDHEPVIGPEGIQRVVENRNQMPAVAIGGINEQNVQEIWETGVDGIAVISAITQADNINETVKNLKCTDRKV